MSENTNSESVTKWVYAVIVLVAIIGLLAGLLISKAATPNSVTPTATVLTETPPNGGTPPPPPNGDSAEQDVKRIVRNLTPARRREVVQQALKNIEKSGYERPRAMLQKRQQARRRAFEITRTEPFDPDAMRRALDEVHKINVEMAKQGTDLTIEVLQLMTQEERKAATQRDPRTRRDRVQQRREDRRQKRRRD